MPSRMLAPSDSLTIRQPTDKSLAKGNIHNPPRYTNLGIGGLNGPDSEGIDKSEFGVKPPAETLRKMPNMKGSKD